MVRLGTLLLSHSSRRTNLERCSRAFLRRRFGRPDRLGTPPSFESLPPARPLFSGALSLFQVDRDPSGRVGCQHGGSVRRRRKIQHAALLDDAELLVGFEHRLERWRLRGGLDGSGSFGRRVSTRAVYEHPHLAGVHTVAPLDRGRVAVACSAADAILIFDPSCEHLEQALRMPESLYGRGYRLTPEMDLRSHYIDDDWQTTHVNAAHPVDGGRRLAVSTLIQGAIGLFDVESESYRELNRGFVGCHGARQDDAGRIYFVDSPRGELVHLDEDGRVARRFPVGSAWLHDAVQLDGELYAFALSDANELRIYDVGTGDLHFSRRFPTLPVELPALARLWPGWLGNSTQALSFRPAALG